MIAALPVELPVAGYAMRPATSADLPALVQRTSDEQRVAAHRVDERLGFVGSHRGFEARGSLSGSGGRAMVAAATRAASA